MELLRVFVVFIISVSAMGQLLSQDILALLEFKKGIKHDPTGYVLSSWNEESVDLHGCPSSWNGIVCDGANVAEVVLDGQALSADVNLGVLSNLTMLVKLSMSRNSMTGRIPKNIGDFKSLQYLDLSDNLFSFTLPSEIGKLGSLKNLSLAGNKFSGPIPESISGLASIESLDLSRNFLSGPLPLSLTKLSKLVVLNLSSNGFEKEIPKGFELMENLQILDLHGNMFDSQIDMQFFLFSSISYLDLSQNMLASSSSQGGKFLPAVSETIKHMNLSHNKLTGSLVGGGGPQVFGNLKVLDLSYNQFSGELPEFNFVYDLEVLKLSSNKFSGFIPSALLKDDSLVITELDLSGNNLSGPLSMITSTNLRVVNLSSNGLSGELPLLIGGCTVLDLSNNQFEGNLTKLMKWDNVGFLDLSRNNLAGPFPEVTSQFTRLNYLNLSHNSLNSISRVLTQIPKLRVLDLSSNQLDGAILPELLTLPTLEELHLENNSLSGSLRFSPPPCKVNLRVLDLSHNQFSGYFPDLVRSMTELKVLSLAGNNLSGALPTSMAAMNSLSSFDISQNYFTGKLPPHLPKSLKSFNISYNNLSGVVPENLKTLPTSSFYPGNTRLKLPISPPGSTNHPAESFKRKPIRTFVIVGVIVACVLGFIILILLAIFIHYIRISKRPLPEHLMNKNTRGRPGSDLSGFSGRDTSEPTVVSADDIMKESPSDIISPEKKMAGTSFSPSRFSWSHDSGDSLTAEILSRLDGRSPSLLVGELHFLDDTITLTPEELSRAPAEVLGRSSRGTSYRATMENGLLLTVKWLREGVAKERKDFTKEAKKFTNIRHPNVVGLKGYYWGPTQHEKLILSDYISPGSLASFLYGKNGSPLAWIQRLRIAVDVARGLNYLHFDRALPHGNLKTTNILLEGPDLSARVADYCLHRLMTQAGAAEQILDAGALGYRAPELAASKKPFPSFKSDVYSFGVVLLELLTGRSAGSTISCEEGGVDLTEWVRLRVAEGRGSECFDPALMAEMAMPAVEKGVNEVLSIALRCVKPVSERPGIKTIYEDLSSV